MVDIRTADRIRFLPAGEMTMREVDRSKVANEVNIWDKKGK